MNDETPQDFDTRLSQLSQFLTYRISRLHSKLNAQASRILSASVGLTLNQWRMIAFIGGAEKITASELINYTAMDKGMVSRNVKSLIEAGLVLSAPHKVDHRIHVLSLSSAGKDIFDTALPVMRRRQTHLKKDISEDDLANFLRVMDVLEDAAKETNI